MTKKERVHIVLHELARLFPETKTALDYNTPWELVVAVVLSAQCTDKKVNEVTKQLFLKYPTIASYADTPAEAFMEDIKQIGLFRGKAKNIVASAKKLLEEYQGEIPRTIKELITFPGVGRKTANVVLTELFGITEGIAVDTHVTRLAQKFGLTKETDPKKIEKDLMRILPKEAWATFTLRMIDYGRAYSPAHKKLDNTDPISVALYTTH